MSPMVYSALPVRPRKLAAYVAPSGRSPFNDWLLGLKDPEGLAAVYNRLDRLSEGNQGDFKRLGELLEFRIHTGPGYRVYAGEDGPTLVILLTGGDKTSQSKDIKQAQRYWHGYQTRKTQAAASL